VIDAPNDVRITGSAVVTTRLSSVTMKTGIPTAARIQPSFAGFRGLGVGLSREIVAMIGSSCGYSLITNSGVECSY
jgi:hypothetical protein